jgi:hypothetical protein
MAKKCLANNDGDFADLNPFIFDYLINFFCKIKFWVGELCCGLRLKKIVFIFFSYNSISEVWTETFQIQNLFFLTIRLNYWTWL